MSLVYNWQDPDKVFEGNPAITFNDVITGKIIGVPESLKDNCWHFLAEHLKARKFAGLDELADGLLALLYGSQPELFFGLLPGQRCSGLALRERARIMSACAIALSPLASRNELNQLRVRCLCDEFPPQIQSLVAEKLTVLGAQWLESGDVLSLASAMAADPLVWSGSAWLPGCESDMSEPDFSLHPYAGTARIGLVKASIHGDADTSLPDIRLCDLQDSIIRLDSVPVFSEQILHVSGDSIVLLVCSESILPVCSELEGLWQRACGRPGFASQGDSFSYLDLAYGLNRKAAGNPSGFKQVLSRLDRLVQERALNCPQANRSPVSQSQHHGVPFVVSSFDSRAGLKGDHEQGHVVSHDSGQALIACRPEFTAMNITHESGLGTWMHSRERKSAAFKFALETIQEWIASEVRSRGSKIRIRIEGMSDAHRDVSVHELSGYAVLCVPEQLAFDVVFRLSDIIERSFARESNAAHTQAFERYKGGFEYGSTAQPAVALCSGVMMPGKGDLQRQGVIENLLSLARSAERLTRLTGRSSVDFLVGQDIFLPSLQKRQQSELRVSTEEGGDAVVSLTGRPYSLVEMQGLVRTAVRLRHAEFPSAQIHDLAVALKSGRMRGTLEYLYMRARAGKNRDFFKHLDEWWHGGASSSDIYSVGRVGGTIRYETFLLDIIELSQAIKLNREVQDASGRH